MFEILFFCILSGFLAATLVVVLLPLTGVRWTRVVGVICAGIAMAAILKFGIDWAARRCLDDEPRKTNHEREYRP
jgi:TRAP-type C4-dicarboxylate transport system permease small subunit